MSRQNYYARRQERKRREVDRGLLLQLVAYQRSIHPRIGVRKLYYLIGPELKKACVKMGRDRMFLELRVAGLLAAPQPSEWPKTTQFRANLPLFGNRIKKLNVTRSNQVWVSDITYIRTEEGFLYLSLITDKWSRKIIGFHLSDKLDGEVCIMALKKALKGFKRKGKLIHHSDRGCQYASHAYVNLLKKEGILVSMTEMNHCAENALAERMNGILKGEYLLGVGFESKEEALKAVTQTIRIYNELRPHWELDMKTPSEVYARGSKASPCTP